MEDSEKLLIKEIHNAMIASAENKCNQKVEPYTYGSAEYNEVSAMIHTVFGPVTSKVLDTILNNPSEYKRLEKYLNVIPQKMPLKLAQKIDELDIQKTEEGKFGEYATICATTEVASIEVGNSLCDGCIQTLSNAEKHTQSVQTEDYTESFAPRTATA